MKLKIKNQENFWSGAMFIGFGMFAIWIAARNYPIGTAMRMGPGYFPTVVGGLLVVLGSIITLSSFTLEGEKIKPFAWRAVIMLGLGFAFFGWAIDRIGFVIGLFVMIFCSALAGREFKLRQVLIMIAILIIGAIALFIYGLELPYPLFW